MYIRSTSAPHSLGYRNDSVSSDLGKAEPSNFAILSKTGKAMQGRAKTGLSLSIVGLCLTLFLTIAMIASTISNGEFQRQYQYYQEYFENTL